MRAGGPRTQVTTGGSRSPRRRAASTCGPEARVPQGQQAAAEAPDGALLPHAGRRLAYPGTSRRPRRRAALTCGPEAHVPRYQPKTQTACRFNIRAGGPRTQVIGSRCVRFVAITPSSNRPHRMYPKAKTSRAGLATLTIRTGLW